MGKTEERRRHQQADAYRQQSVAEKLLHEILETEAYDGHRDAAHQYLADVIEIGVAAESKEGAAEAEEHRPQDDDGAQHSGGVYYDVELQRLVRRDVDAQNLPENFEMSARRDGEVLGQPLHNTED